MEQGGCELIRLCSMLTCPGPGWRPEELHWCSPTKPEAKAALLWVPTAPGLKVRAHSQPTSSIHGGWARAHSEAWRAHTAQKEEPWPSVTEALVHHLGSWYNPSLKSPRLLPPLLRSLCVMTPQSYGFPETICLEEKFHISSGRSLHVLLWKSSRGTTNTFTLPVKRKDQLSWLSSGFQTSLWEFTAGIY